MIVDTYQMKAKKNPCFMPYKDFSGSAQEYSLLSWEREFDHVEEHEKRDRGDRKATNPPKLLNVFHYYLQHNVFSEDGHYVIPAYVLAEGVLSGVQHRQLIGVSYGS